MNAAIKATRNKVDVKIILSALWAARMLSSLHGGFVPLSWFGSAKWIDFGNSRNTSNQYDAIDIVNNIVDPNLYDFSIPDVEC